jgi:hypothetical protein
MGCHICRFSLPKGSFSALHTYMSTLSFPEGTFGYQKIPNFIFLEVLGVENVDRFNGHLVYFWYFGIFFSVFVCCTKENLANLIKTYVPRHTYTICTWVDRWASADSLFKGVRKNS